MQSTTASPCTPLVSTPLFHVLNYKMFKQKLFNINHTVFFNISGDPLYRINTHLSARVHRLNPDDEASNAEIMKCFNKAMDLVGAEFKEVVLEVNININSEDRNHYMISCISRQQQHGGLQG